jgi:hypothetical protein
MHQPENAPKSLNILKMHTRNNRYNTRLYLVGRGAKVIIKEETLRFINIVDTRENDRKIKRCSRENQVHIQCKSKKNNSSEATTMTKMINTKTNHGAKRMT